MTRTPAVFVMMLFVLAVAQAAGPSEAEYHDDGCCSGGLYPVCRRVCVTKKKPHVEYEVKCELVCVPGCSLLAPCHDGCTCGNAVLREKRVLLKKITEKEVKTYEYKVFWVCRGCAFGGGCSGDVNP